MKQNYIHDRRSVGHDGGAIRVHKLIHPIRRFLAGRILDVGCSDGSFMDEFRRFDLSPVGVDMGDDLIADCRARGLEVHKADLADGLPFPDASFDTVFCSHTLEHVYNPFPLLLECHRVCAPGGRLVLILPNSMNLRRATFMRGHVNYYDVDNVYYTLRSAGFAPLFIKSDLPLAARVRTAALPLTPGNWADDRQRAVLRFLPVLHMGINLYAVGRRAENAGPGGARDARGVIGPGETSYG
jgi:methionine biosynthesis protein MetW